MSEHALQHDQDAESGRSHKPEGCYYAGSRVSTSCTNRMLAISNILLMLIVRTNVHGHATDGRGNDGGSCL